MRATKDTLTKAAHIFLKRIPKHIPPRQTSLDALCSLGAADFIHGHAPELQPIPHSGKDCPFPGYFLHVGTIVTNQEGTAAEKYCGTSDLELYAMARLGGKTPFLYYAQLERAIAARSPHVKMAVIPGIADWGDRRAGNLADVVLHVQPYGLKADELLHYLNQTGIDAFGNPLPAFHIAACVGFLRLGLGYAPDGSPFAWVDLMQTDGYSLIRIKDDATGALITRHVLPADLRKRYLDGKKHSVNAWQHEALDALEAACAGIGLPLGIITADEANRIMGASFSASATKQKLYQSPRHRGYAQKKMQLNFPHKVVINPRFQGAAWVKR